MGRPVQPPRSRHRQRRRPHHTGRARRSCRARRLRRRRPWPPSASSRAQGRWLRLGAAPLGRRRPRSRRPGRRRPRRLAGRCHRGCHPRQRPRCRYHLAPRRRHSSLGRRSRATGHGVECRQGAAARGARTGRGRKTAAAARGARTGGGRKTAAAARGARTGGERKTAAGAGAGAAAGAAAAAAGAGAAAAAAVAAAVAVVVVVVVAAAAAAVTARQWPPTGTLPAGTGAAARTGGRSRARRQRGAPESGG
ncbi:hypothetical protein BU14_0707s0008 [Porphyra umbilicalis]|uniref:Uncharacterized protein n=1 Tax=Porphyra umbilicalis TaxID=2786 RepID=A0A1X6NPY5_PORUM|nr:hypothetical protein BU14_0707s0008 [Porphyra umbilicalis]|eukprot:OSX70635.1 hypothetical protein BU14_0707s0008 [Porphyra umbilicalis]